MMEEPITQSPVFLGVCRPKDMLGASYQHVIFSGVLTSIIFLGSKYLLGSPNIFFLLFYIPMHIVGIVLFKYDPYFYQLISRRGTTRWRARLTGKSWGGGAAYSHAPSRWNRSSD